MTWHVEWLPTAHKALLDILPRSTAARVDAAIQRYAKKGEGNVVPRLPDDDAMTIRLQVPPYVARLTLDSTTSTIWVVAVYRR